MQLYSPHRDNRFGLHSYLYDCLGIDVSLVRLTPHMYLLTPFGVAEAHFYESPESFETNSVWTCFQVETKENWLWPSPLVRLCESISGMRSEDCSAFQLTDEYFETLLPHILRHRDSPFYERAKAFVNKP